MSISPTVLSQISPPIPSANDPSSGAGGGNSTVTQDQFLQLLVTQLKSQDPLNPQDPSQFTAQLAQFSSLEQLTKINSSLGSLGTQQAQSSQYSAVSYIGHTASVTGDAVTVGSGTANALHYTLPATSTKTSLAIYDANGKLVQTLDLGQQSAGAHDYQWGATDPTGTKVADGNYTMQITAQDSAGNALTAATSVSGKITGVDYSNGTPMLNINGQSYPISSITSITS